MEWQLKDLCWGQEGGIGESGGIIGADLGWENEWELEDLSEARGCKGEGITVLLRKDEMGIRRPR